MGRHVGWAVYQIGKRFRGQVWLPELKKYRCKTFTVEAEARKWAKHHASGVHLGRPSAEIEAPARTLTEYLAEDYKNDLTARLRSPSHLRNITLTLTGLAEVAPDLAAPTAGHAIEGWLNAMRVSPATRNRRLVEVRAFCHWLMKRDLLAKDPTRAIERSAVPDYLRDQFTVAELVKILALPTPDPDFHRRFALMVLAGLRSDEAAALTWDDVDLASRLITVREHAGYRLKRRRERIVPLQRALADLLGDRQGGSDHVAPMGNGNLRRRFPLFLNRVGVPVRNRSAHSCRHTYAGMLTATGVPTALVGAYLGHTAAATTMLYTKLAASYVNSVAGWERGELLSFP